MIPVAFDYVRAQSVEEAIGLLEKHGDDAKLLAGGHSLIPMMKLRLAAPATLIDIAGIPHMNTIAVSGGRVTIGALTTHASIAASAELEEHAPALWDAANQLGDPQVRNRGTIGGSCAHGDPSADYPAVLLMLDATFAVVGRGGTRRIGAAEFFRGMFDTALGAGEVLTEISFDSAPNSAYIKYHHPASHYAVVGVAASLSMDGNAIGSARIAIAGVGDAAFRATTLEATLNGKSLSNQDEIRSAFTGVAAGVDARSDTFASGTYRAAMADVYAARALAAAVNPNIPRPWTRKKA
ncbi:MAG: xanthine dehydrogenase family protein subunit M [Candidatus Velthaea sp.]